MSFRQLLEHTCDANTDGNYGSVWQVMVGRLVKKQKFSNQAADTFGYLFVTDKPQPQAETPALQGGGASFILNN